MFLKMNVFMPWNDGVKNKIYFKKKPDFLGAVISIIKVSINLMYLWYDETKKIKKMMPCEFMLRLAGKEECPVVVCVGKNCGIRKGVPPFEKINMYLSWIQLKNMAEANVIEDAFVNESMKIEVKFKGEKNSV